MHLCIWDNLSIHLKEIQEKVINREKAIGPFSLLALIDDPELQKIAADTYISEMHPKIQYLSKLKINSKYKKIRVGYFSADFRDHAVSQLTAELYELHDRGQFEIHAFSFGPDTKDEFNLRVKAGVDHYHDVRSLSDMSVVLLSRSEKIDIAVDLGGFTKNSRTQIFAMQAAPIQVNYLGYSGTMASDYMDYIIADHTIIPEDKKHHYSESIVYLPYSYMVTDSKIKKPKMQFTREDAGLPLKGFIFCCFNQHYKIAPATFMVWMRILKQVKGSILWLSEANSVIISNLKKEAIKNGVEGDRLIFAPRLAFKEDHLSRMQLADLFLDTLPYNAHTTCSDALQMGVPVLTCIGNSFTSRVAASLLNAVNLPELITKTQDQYESLAIQLSTNSQKFTSIKDKLVNNLSTAPLFNSPMFTQYMELAYIEMYEKYCNGIKPEGINIEK